MRPIRLKRHVLDHILTVANVRSARIDAEYLGEHETSAGLAITVATFREAIRLAAKLPQVLSRDGDQMVLDVRVVTNSKAVLLYWPNVTLEY